jgi:hypothetical protein
MRDPEVHPTGRPPELKVPIEIGGELRGTKR